MIQLFSKILLGLIFVKEYILHYYKFIKRKLLSITHIYDLKTNNNVFYEYLLSKYITNHYDYPSDFFCEFNNNYGIYKIILKNITLKEIIEFEDSINKDKNNLTDGLYNNKLCTSIQLTNINTNINLNIMNFIIYIDKTINLTLKELFIIYNVKYTNYDNIIINYMSYDDYNDYSIESTIESYLNKQIIEIL
jgi:hypothetical protein